MAEEYNEIGLKERIIKKVWEDEDFKNALLANPKAAIEKELEISIPENMVIKVVEETPTTAYLVLPVSPSQAQTEATGTVDGLEVHAMTYI